MPSFALSCCEYLRNYCKLKVGAIYSCPHFRGSLFCTHLYVAGTVDSVLIKGGVFISGVVLYTSLCSWDRGQCTD